jgi:hypothetical protein
MGGPIYGPVGALGLKIVSQMEICTVDKGRELVDRAGYNDDGTVCVGPLAPYTLHFEVGKTLWYLLLCLAHAQEPIRLLLGLVKSRGLRAIYHIHPISAVVL